MDNITATSSLFVPEYFQPFSNITRHVVPQTPLWASFDKVSSSLLHIRPSEFEFVRGRTSLSTFQETASLLVAYYAIIFGGREVMRNRKAFDLNNAFKVHNFALSIASGFMLALFMEQLVPALFQFGIFDTVCGSPGWTQPLETLYYMNYATKYIELFDTLFLVLRKKPLTFLHTYHHGATALLCYTQLIGKTPVSWVPITANLLVHVVMYWYYFQAARGIKVWWKRYITQLQIAQFVLDLGFIYFASWSYFSSTYYPSLPHIGTCKGEEFAAVSGCVILTSYLVLFVLFYLRTYKTVKTEKRVTKENVRVENRVDVKVVEQVTETKKPVSLEENVDASLAQ